MLRAAKGGGSVTPSVLKVRACLTCGPGSFCAVLEQCWQVLRKLQDEGRLTILEGAEVTLRTLTRRQWELLNEDDGSERLIVTVLARWHVPRGSHAHRTLLTTASGE